MAGDWREVALGDVIELKRGFDLPQQNRREGHVPIVSSSGVTDHHAEAKIKGPGVVTGRYGTIGQVFYVTEDFWPLNTTLYVYDFKGNDPRFISYFLQSVDFFAYSDKAAVPGLNRNHLHMARLLFPVDVEDQRTIAYILGTLDDKIELNCKMNQTLEAMARAIFKSWFVDFDPVRAKAEGSPSTSLGHPIPGLPPNLADLFPDGFEDSELGEIPKGWRVMPVGDALKTVGGSTPSTGNSIFWDNGEYHWATPKDLSSLSSPILTETERKITKAGVEEISSGLLPAGTLLMSSRAPVGYLAISAIPVAVNQGFIAMVCDGPVSNYYALNWCHYNMEEIQQRASGTTFAEISKAAFRPISMIVPADTIMKSFTQIVEPLYRSIEEWVKETRTLVALRDALLPKLLSGKIRVRNAEEACYECFY